VCGNAVCEAGETCSTCGDCPCSFHKVELLGQQVDVQNYLLQCEGDGSRRLVWWSTGLLTDTSGTNTVYDYIYDEPATDPCGGTVGGVYPLVIKTWSGTAPVVGAYLLECTEAPGMALVFQIAGTLASGEPFANFLYRQPQAFCN
jgi:hypothetical protein